MVLQFYLFHFKIGFPLLFTVVATSIELWLLVQRRRLSGSWLIRGLFWGVNKVFFREVIAKGTGDLPASGPILFVCGPHANQFIDPTVIITCLGEEVSFLCAAKTLRRQYVGAVAAGTGAIAVERPQDIKVKKQGLVTIEGTAVRGTGTAFTADGFQAGDSLWVHQESQVVASIEGDDRLTLQRAFTATEVQEAAFSVSPRLDQSEVFASVHEALAQGRRVGIFPEGGSHDRTELLPLKAGVTIMALGAEAKFPGLGVKIVPVGLNYYHPHRFRSRAYVEFGQPMTVPPALIEQYQHGDKRAACGELLTIIKKGLDRVTVTAPDHETLQMMWTVERLYRPQGARLSVDVRQRLARTLEKGYERFKDSPEVQRMSEKVRDYQDMLSWYNLKDHQVARTPLTQRRSATILLWRLVVIFVYLLSALPGLVLNAPIIILTRIVSKQKQKEALKSSTVKIRATDVVATWKVLVTLVVLPMQIFVVYPILSVLVAWGMGWSALRTWAYFALAQPFVSYSSVRIIEIGWATFRSLPPLIMDTWDPTKTGKLRHRRKALQKEVRQMVNTYGQKLFGDDFVPLDGAETDDEEEEKNDRLKTE